MSSNAAQDGIAINDSIITNSAPESRPRKTVRERLAAAGYGDAIIRVRPRSKEPAGAGWRTHILSDAELALEGENTGIRTDDFAFIDIDCDHLNVSRLAASEISAAFGAAPQRWRGARVALPFRTEGGRFPKQIFVFREPSGVVRFKWEVLAEGQQVVIDGEHPSGARYSDQHGAPFGAALAAVPAAALPGLSLETIRGKLLGIAQRVAARIGCVATLEGGATRAERANVNQDSLRAESVEDVRALMLETPNDIDDRGEWMKWAAAIKGAAGSEGEDIFVEWSSRYAGPQRGDDYARAQYRSLGDVTLGWDALQDFARRIGVNTAALEFEAIAEKLVVAPLVPAYPAERERISALHQSPAASFTEEARDAIERPSERGTLLGRYNAHVEASHGSDPLAPLYDAVVYPTALKVGKGHPERLFARMLEARLAGFSAFASLSDAERALLVRAAYLKLAPPVLFDFDAPGDAMTDAEADASNDLVAGILPWFGVLGIFGESKAGKSFIALGLAMLLARDVDSLTKQPPPAAWIGAPVGAGHVLYCASEGQAGQWRRYRRAEKKYGSSPNFTLLKRVPSLLDLESTVAFFAKATRGLPPLAAIVVDVLISALAGGEENSNEDMNTALSNLRLAGMLFGCSTIAVHHAGKGQQDTARGASAWRGSLDAELKVSRTGETIIGTLTKVKDGRDGDSFPWHLDGDGVLTTGVAPAKVTGEIPSASTSDAEYLDRALLKIAQHDFVSRAEINRALADECPQRLDPKRAGVNRSTVVGRVSQALFENLGRGWMVQKGSKYKLGPNSPAKLERDKAANEMRDLVGEFGGDAREVVA